MARGQRRPAAGYCIAVELIFLNILLVLLVAIYCAFICTVLRADTFAWAGARTLVQQASNMYANLSVKRAEYEEKGFNVCRLKFKSVFHVSAPLSTPAVASPSTPLASSS